MRRILGLVALALGIIFAGSWVAAQAQTGDCYLMLPGCLDSSFGLNGIVNEPAGMKVNGVAIQSVGGEARIVTVGQIGSAWAIARYLPNGSLDTSFGRDKTGIIPVLDSGSGTAYGAVVQPLDNMLIVVGSVPTQVVYQHKTYVRDQLYVFRYDQFGKLDPNFGSGGKVRVSDPDFPASPTVGRAVALQSDGMIVVLGSYSGWPGVVRLTSKGVLDTNFSADGQYIYTPSVSAGFAIAVQPINGKEYIVVAGEDRPNRNFSVFRLTPEGALDTKFGNGGVVTTHLVENSVQEFYEGVAVDSLQRILAVGDAGPVSTFDWNPKMLVARYMQDGAPDGSFDSDGKVSPSSRLHYDYARAVAIQRDGRIVVAGSISTYDNLSYMSAWRFNEDGSPDLSFGDNGWVSTGLSASATAIAIQPDGKIVLAGNVSKPTPNPFLARYYGYLPPFAGNDIAVYSISAAPVLATQGENIAVRVTVGNNGNQQSTNTVNLTASNGDNIGSLPVSLQKGQTVTLPFAWSSSTQGTYTLTAELGSHDGQPENDSRSTSVNVAPPVTISLSARGYRVATAPMVDLTWNVTSATSIDIYRNEPEIIRVRNTGKYTDQVGPNKSNGTFKYKVCEAGSTTRCSNTATVVF